MIKRIHSIRTRLLVIAALMVLATAAFVTLIGYDAARRQVESSIKQRSSATFSIIEQGLRSRVQAGATIQQLDQWLAANYADANYRIYITDRSGTVLADSQGTMIGKKFETPTTPPIAVLSRNGQIVGLVYIRQQPGWERFPWLQRVLNTPDSGALLILGGVLSAIVSIALVAALFQYLLHPVKDLTTAAEAMAAGDLSRRVEVSGKDELGNLGRAFNTMAASLEHDKQIQRDMITDIAHELRTPLTNIQGYLEAAQDDIVPIDNDLVETLLEETNLLSHLVKDLQQLSLAETGQLTIETTRVLPGEAIEEAVQAFAAQAHDQGISLSKQISADLPAVCADPLRLAEILRNLVSNALRYTLSQGSVTLSAMAQKDMIRFSVIDTGVGIAPDELPRVFDRLYRADSARARATGGTGLGLTIVRQLVQAHGGDVGANSTLGEGSEFWFTLPIWSKDQIE